MGAEKKTVGCPRNTRNTRKAERGTWSARWRGWLGRRFERELKPGGTSRARVRVWAAPAVGAPRGRAAAARVGALLATSWQVLTRLRLPVAGLRSSAPDARAGGTWYRACAPAPRSCTTWLRAGDTQPAIVRYTVCNRALQRGGRALPGCGRTPHGRGRPPPGCGRARPLCRLSVTVRRRLKTWFLAVFQCVKVS
jgi:hypothetical protein